MKERRCKFVCIFTPTQPERDNIFSLGTIICKYAWRENKKQIKVSSLFTIYLARGNSKNQHFPSLTIIENNQLCCITVEL